MARVPTWLWLLGGGLLVWIVSSSNSAAAASSADGSDGELDMGTAPTPPPYAPGPQLRNMDPSNSTEAQRLAAFLPYFQQGDSNYGLPQGLTQRIAYVESRYNPRASSTAGAIGIMQLEPSSFPGVDPWDPVASIDAGAGYLGKLYAQFGAWTLAIAAYNAGPGNVSKYGGIPPFPETEAYVQNVAGALNLLDA